MKEFKRIVRFKNNVNQDIVDFVKSQSNFSETVTYLIEKEIHENGIRNVVHYIPIIRTEDYFNKMLGKDKSTNREEVIVQEEKQKKKASPTKKSDSVLEECFDD